MISKLALEEMIGGRREIHKSMLRHEKVKRTANLAEITLKTYSPSN